MDNSTFFAYICIFKFIMQRQQHSLPTLPPLINLKQTNRTAAMSKLCLNSRDELLFIDLEKIAFFKANGNYTNITYIEGQQQMLTMGLSKIEQVLRTALPQGKPSPFLRLGRSLIINQTYLYSISVVRQRLSLSDFCGHIMSLAVPKQLLRDYKDKIALLYSGISTK